jgi:iron complex transport system substrate-binding protein
VRPDPSLPRVRIARRALVGVAVAVAAGLALTAAAGTPVPRRLVTLAPHLTELVYAAGAGERIVGTMDTSDYPEAARRIPRIGDVTRIDAERLLALAPDLVIAWGDGTPAEQFAQLKRLGLPTLSLAESRLEDVPASLELLGRRLGTEPVADAAARAFRASIAALRERYAGRPRLRVFYQVWDLPLYTLGGTQVVTEMLSVCGADNVFAGEPHSGFAVDPESVYARRPDVIVLAGSPREREAWRGRWAKRPALAVEFVSLEPELANRMGPRLVDGTRVLCERLDAVRAGRSAGGGR